MNFVEHQSAHSDLAALILMLLSTLSNGGRSTYRGAMLAIGLSEISALQYMKKLGSMSTGTNVA